MKKIVISLMLLGLMISSGCADKTNVSEETQKPVTNNVTYTEETTESTTSNTVDVQTEKEEYNFNCGTLDSSYLVDIGCNVEQIIALRGDVSESVWDDGPWYRFDDSGLWYAFENYDFDDETNTYIPKDDCNCITLELNRLVSGADEYSARTVEALCKSALDERYSEFFGCNVYTAKYGEYKLEIVADSYDSINGSSIVKVTHCN